MAPPRQIVVQCRRRQDEQVGHAPSLKDVAKDDQPAERMTVQHHWRAARPRPNPGKLAFQVVVHVAPLIHVGLSPAPEPPLVVGVDLEPRLRHCIADVLVAAAVLTEPMDNEDARPRLPGRRPSANQEIGATRLARQGGRGRRHRCAAWSPARARQRPETSSRAIVLIRRSRASRKGSVTSGERTSRMESFGP